MKEKKKIIINIIAIIVVIGIVVGIFAISKHKQTENNITNSSYQNEIDNIEPQDPIDENPSKSIQTPTK